MQGQQTTDRLGTEKVGKLLFSLALPAIAAQLVNMLYNIVDRIYIGRIPEIGPLALTGVGVSFPIIILISAFAALVGMGGAPLAAIRLGAGKDEEAEKILGTSFTAMIITSTLLTVLFLLFNERLLVSFGASGETLPYALSYLNTYVLGTFFVQVALGLNAFISTQGFAKTSMLTVVIGAVINIILDPIFIFVFGLGVRGAAIASVISQGVSAIWVLYFLVGPKTKLRLSKANLGINWPILQQVLLLGISPFIMQSTESLLNITLNTSLQRFGGDLAVGSMTIIASLMQFVMLPLFGLTQGAQPIISYNFGAKQFGRVKEAFRILLVLSIGFSGLMWLAMMLKPQMFVFLFTNNLELTELTVWALRIFLSAVFVLGAQVACQQTFIALGQAKVSLFLALLRKVILLIPLIYILPYFFANKVFAVFLAEPVADFVATSVTVFVFIQRTRKLLLENVPDTLG